MVACRALLQLCAMGFIMEYVIRSNNPWLVLLLVAFMLIAAVQITLSRAKVFRRAWLDRCS